MPRRVLVGFGVDVDAVSGWYVPPHAYTLLMRSSTQVGVVWRRRLRVRHFAGMHSLDCRSRHAAHDDALQGLYAGEVGTPRLLNLFKKYGIKTTWFIPGETALRLAGRTHVLTSRAYGHKGTALRRFPRRWLLYGTRGTRCKQAQCGGRPLTDIGTHMV